MVEIKIEDRLCRKTEIHIYITTPQDYMRYDAKVIDNSVKELVELLHEHTSSGFCQTLSEVLKE
jgi:hypothetical protein